MHELSIAMSLVDAACDELPHLGDGARISAVHVRVGRLAGVVPEALLFAFDVAAAGTAIEGARLEIQHVSPSAWCNRCQREQIIDSVPRMLCPACGTPTPDIVKGRELDLTALEVLDADANR